MATKLMTYNILDLLESPLSFRRADALQVQSKLFSCKMIGPDPYSSRRFANGYRLISMIWCHGAPIITPRISSWGIFHSSGVRKRLSATQ